MKPLWYMIPILKLIKYDVDFPCQLKYTGIIIQMVNVMLINKVNASIPNGVFHGGLLRGYYWKGYGYNGQEVTISGLHDYNFFRNKKTMMPNEIIELSNTHRVEYYPLGSLFG